jgi:hypothetical protein
MPLAKFPSVFELLIDGIVLFRVHWLLAKNRTRNSSFHDFRPKKTAAKRTAAVTRFFFYKTVLTSSMFSSS